MQSTTTNKNQSSCKVHQDHGHIHGKNCGHRAVKHGDHIDYEHDGHFHRMHGDHVDECQGPAAKLDMKSGASNNEKKGIKKETMN